VTQQSWMFTTGNLGRRRRSESEPEVDMLAVARMRRTVLPARVRKRCLPRPRSEKNDGRLAKKPQSICMLSFG